MKILVIDDTRIHLDAATQVLEGHDITLCSSHDEALKLLREGYDKEERKRKLEEYKNSDMEWGDAWDKSLKETYWDVVLCDLLMPAGSNAQGGEGLMLVGQEMSVGWSLALIAAMNGAKHVAVVTDMNHHHHPASAMLDGLDGHVFEIDGAKMFLTNSMSKVGIEGTECNCEKCGGTGKDKEDKCFYCKDGVDFTKKGKDWGKVLDKLLK